MIRETIRPRVRAAGSAAAGGVCVNGTVHTSVYQFECYGRPRFIDYLRAGFGLLGPVLGPLKWSESAQNIVTDAGLDDQLDKYLKGSSYTASFFVGLVSASPVIAAGDTLASAAWSELTAYTEANRPSPVLGSVSGQSVDNSASRAQFSINADSQSIGGALLATDNTKGGTSGILYSVVAFQAGNKGLDNGDTLNVTITLTASRPA